ncbi:MAG: VOC family protein [Muribaculaceae bacterium]
MINLSEYSSGIQHVGIPTNDIEATVRFYEALGFVNEYSTRNGDELVAFLRMGNLVIETYQNHKAALCDGAINHIAIDVKNIDDLYAEIRRDGLKVFDNSMSQLPFWENGIKYFIIEGPNAERLEFCERL